MAYFVLFFKMLKDKCQQGYVITSVNVLFDKKDNFSLTGTYRNPEGPATFKSLAFKVLSDLEKYLLATLIFSIWLYVMMLLLTQ